MAILSVGCKQIAYKATPPGSAGTFLPQTFPSSWTYRDSIFGEKTDTFQVYGSIVDTLTYHTDGLTTDWNSQICYDAIVTSKLHGKYTAYFYNYNHLFYIMEPTLLSDETVLYLANDTASMGYTWEELPTIYGVINHAPAITINSILEKNITKIVNGITYSNVVHTGVNLQIDKGFGYHNIAYYNMYATPGVGLIEEDAYIIDSYTETKTLLRSSIAAQ